MIVCAVSSCCVPYSVVFSKQLMAPVKMEGEAVEIIYTVVESPVTLHQPLPVVICRHDSGQ